MEVGVITATAQQSYGLIGVHKDEATENVKRAVAEQAEKQIIKVNEKHVVPDGVHLTGKCSQCEKIQPWAFTSRHSYLKILAGALGLILGIVIGSLVVSKFGSTMDGTFGLFIWFLFVVLGAYGGSKLYQGIFQLYTKKAMGDCGEHYYPHFIDAQEEKK